MSRMIKRLPKESFSTPYVERIIRNKITLQTIMSQFGVLTVGSRRNGSEQSHYSGYVDHKGENIYLFHAEKRRRKVKHEGHDELMQHIKGLNLQAKPYQKYAPNKIRSNHWKVRIFKFPLDRVVDATQYNRTFTITLK